MLNASQRRPLRLGGDPSLTAQPPDTGAPAPCRCRGTGAYVVNIPVADAVVSDRRLCLDHGLTPRALLMDNATPDKRLGELMDVTGEDPDRRAHLRPVGGGCEWSTAVEDLRPAPASDARNAPEAVPGADDPTGSPGMSGATRSLLLRFGVRYDTVGRLEAAGLTTLEQLAPMTRAKLMNVPDMTADGAQTVVRAIGKLIDVRYSTTR